MNDYFRRNGSFSAEQLRKFTIKDSTDIFGQDPENAPIQELMQLFTVTLNDFGEYLSEESEEDFLEFVKAANGSAKTLV